MQKEINFYQEMAPSTDYKNIAKVPLLKRYYFKKFWKRLAVIFQNCFQLKMTVTVGENIIATTKIRNNYGAIQSFIFFIAPCKVITLNPLCILFSISSLLLF